MVFADLITGLPGELFVRAGLADVQAENCTIPACLARMASPRLARAGLLPGGTTRFIPEPELQLYRLLRRQGGDAYSRYNALVRELVSFEHALDQRRRIQERSAERAGRP